MKSAKNGRNANRRVGGVNQQKEKIKDPIQVFCRIRPLENENEVVCIKKKENDDGIVVMTPPDSLLTARGGKEVHYSFKQVFDENASQKMVFDHLAFPMINNLFQGINGLLFTYGITSSGKTFTVTGTPQYPGILPRSLDVILNSLKEFQAQKYVFKSDKFNSFEIQTPEEAQADLRAENGVKSRQKKKDYLGDWCNRVSETTVIDDINPDYAYTAFISYIEIYNNYIYDLLEDTFSTDTYPKHKIQSKMLREDANKNPYVFNATELEVQTADEALELFCKGQLRRRISHTTLNAKSSRSHSVFTVRIVKAPLNSQGSEVMQDKNEIVISQLSIVDLAGSERLLRTGNKGKQQQEAGNINTSLMALRKCIEALRENQKQMNQRMVPYRESKLTQLFKPFFEGEGSIRMVVCVNPHVDDYAETMFVMQFAEVSQEVLIHRGTTTPMSVKTNLTMKSGRGIMYREAIRKAKEEGLKLEDVLEPVTYSLGPEFPPFTLEGPYNEDKFSSLIEFLNARKIRRQCLTEELVQKQTDFRLQLVNMEKQNISLTQDNVLLQMDLKAREQQVQELERKLSSTTNDRDLLTQKLNSAETRESILRSKLNERENKLSAEAKEKEKMKTKMHDKIQSEKDRLKRIMEKRLAEKQAELERKMCISEEKFRQLREILNSGDWEIGDFFSAPVTTTAKSTNVPNRTMTRAKTTIDQADVVQHKANAISNHNKAKSTTHITADSNAVFKVPQKSVAVANPRHRRSHSSSDNVWLEHKPVGSLDLGTVFQPKMKKKKSVSKLEIKDVTNNDVSKYVLTHQEQDSQGELETKLYKADVIPSAGGGAQVIFNDVEKLRQESPPPSYNLRKRSAENSNLHNIEQNCAIGIECHGVPSKVLRK